MYMLLIFFAFAGIIVVNALSGGEGIGSILGYGRGVSWLTTLALFAAILFFAGQGAKQRWDGVFIDRDNRVSLSRFQLVLWILLLVASFFTSGLSNAFGAGDGKALDIEVPTQIWALLGLGALSAVAAPAIKDARRGGPAAPAQAPPQGSAKEAASMQLIADQKLLGKVSFDGDVLQKEKPRDARWMDMILGDYEGGAYVDASKLQQLAFTVLIVVVYASDLWGKMNAAGGIHKFPDVSSGFLALLSISHVAYLADKQLAKT